MRWRIYYEDGTTFSDRDGSAFEAPTRGAQVIAEEAKNERGFILMHGRLPAEGYYCWYENLGGWHHRDIVGFFDYLYHQPGPKHVVFGTPVMTDLFNEIIIRAGKEGLGG